MKKETTGIFEFEVCPLDVERPGDEEVAAPYTILDPVERTVDNKEGDARIVVNDAPLCLRRARRARSLRSMLDRAHRRRRTQRTRW